MFILDCKRKHMRQEWASLKMGRSWRKNNTGKRPPPLHNEKELLMHTCSMRVWVENNHDFATFKSKIFLAKNNNHKQIINSFLWYDTITNHSNRIYRRFSYFSGMFYIFQHECLPKLNLVRVFHFENCSCIYIFNWATYC